jgi:hypothetical protein
MPVSVPWIELRWSILAQERLSINSGGCQR